MAPNESMQPFLKTYGLTAFLTKIKIEPSLQMDFEIFEVDSWDFDGNPIEITPYMSGTIKWDGCAHLYFGGEENGTRDGYLHFCGQKSWKKHAELMAGIYELAQKNIVGFEG